MGAGTTDEDGMFPQSRLRSYGTLCALVRCPEREGHSDDTFILITNGLRTKRDKENFALTYSRADVDVGFVNLIICVGCVRAGVPPARTYS